MNANSTFCVFPDPLGMALGVAEGGRLERLAHFASRPEALRFLAAHYGPAREAPDAPPLAQLRQQLDEYFAGTRRAFELPLEPRGSTFERQVWGVLQEIPWGTTRTYGQIAEQVGQPGAPRAVGRANGRNPLPVVIPCHRVVAAGGLGGYTGGRDRKHFLLALEGVLLGIFDPPAPAG